MKKLTVLAALLLAVSAGGTAFAQTEYDPATKSVKTTDQSSYKTVLITAGDETTPVTNNNIVYVAQAADTGFEAATNFLLKHNSSDGTGVADGVYTIRFGGGTEAHEPAEFAVGVGIDDYDTTLTNLDKEPDPNGKYSWSFVTSEEGVSFSKGGIILVKLGDDVMAYPTNNGIIYGDVNVVFGVQIDEVPAEVENVAVYFRPGASIKK